ncbi:hypothetical protein BYT27DRAFT_7334333 [Phlegmacium glaucopus]|nr:hypothetical protein BYT27DRAFT_7334333 [Phlegmacium glaucopus]
MYTNNTSPEFGHPAYYFQLSGTTTRGHSANNAGAGLAQRPPVNQPSIVDCNPTQQRGRKPHDRDRSCPSVQRLRTDLSVRNNRWLQGSTMPSTPVQRSVGPIMGQQLRHQHQPPPSRNQHNGRRRTEARYGAETSSGPPSRDRSICNAGAGSTQRPPSSYPSIVDGNLIQTKRSKPYDRDRSGPSLRRLRTDLSIRRGSRIEYPCCDPFPAPSMWQMPLSSAPSLAAPCPAPPPRDLPEWEAAYRRVDLSVYETTIQARQQVVRISLLESHHRHHRHRRHGPSPSAAPTSTPASATLALTAFSEMPDEEAVTNANISMQEHGTVAVETPAEETCDLDSAIIPLPPISPTSDPSATI